jgi:YD repeat-containing protein
MRMFYDDSNQLTKVLDAAGTLLEYLYDPVGNMLEVKRSTVSPTSLSIFNITPAFGPPGINARIYGQNFAATVAGNIVRLNGIPVTVLSASPTELLIQVPAGDTTGPITVTVAGQTASSGSLQFRGVRIPVITKVTPVAVEPGAPFSLVIEGTDLDDAILGTSPAGGFSLLRTPNGFGSPITVRAYAGLPGLYAVVATNVAGTSAATLTPNNQFRVNEAPGPKEAVTSVTSIQNGARESIGFPSGSREAISASVSVQNGDRESFGLPSRSREAFAATTSLLNGQLSDIGFPVGSREGFASVTSVRNGLAATSLSSGVRPSSLVTAREILLNPASTGSELRDSITAGETVTFAAAGLSQARLFLADQLLAEDPEGLGRWTITIPPSARQLPLRMEGIGPAGDPVRSSANLSLRAEEDRPVQALLRRESGVPLADTLVSIEPNGFLLECFDLSQFAGRLPVLTTLQPVHSRVVDGLHLRNPQAIFGRESWNPQLVRGLAVRARTQLDVEQEGLYRFHLRAAAGTRIEVGGTSSEVQAGAEFVQVEANLSRGKTTIEIIWSRADASVEMELFYAPPQGRLAAIPAALLGTGVAETVRTSAEGLLSTNPLANSVRSLRLWLLPAGAAPDDSWIVSLPTQNSLEPGTAARVLGILTLEPKKPRSNP